ncbi:MAG: hypothetical protein WDM81_17450 [Rhizomicrobium sp.]
MVKAIAAPRLRPSTAPSARAARRYKIILVQPERGGEGPVQRQRHFMRRRDAQRVARLGEHDQAFQVVITVVAARPDMQEQVDLGRRVNSACHPARP